MVETLSAELVWLFEFDADEQVLQSRAYAAARPEAMLAQFEEALGGTYAAFQVPVANSQQPLAAAMEAESPVYGQSVDVLTEHTETRFLFEVLSLLEINRFDLAALTLNSRGLGLLLVGRVEASSLDEARLKQLTEAMSRQASLSLDYNRLMEHLIEQEEMMQLEQAFLSTILDTMGDGLIVIGQQGEIEYINKRLLRMTGYQPKEVLSSEVSILFHPDDRAELMRGLLLGRSSTMKFDQRLFTKNGREIPVLMSRSSFARIDPDAPQQVLVLSDLTEQKHREEALERQSQQLQALNQAAQAITSSLSPHEVITQILNAAVQMIGALGASVLLRSVENPDELMFVATVGPASDVIQGRRVPIGSGIAGWVAREAKSQLVSDADQDDRFYSEIDRVSGLRTRSVLAVPLVVSDRVLGVLEAIDRAPNAFDNVDMELMENIASTAAVALENARLFDQTRHRLNDLGTLLDASAAVSSTLDFGSVLELIARRLVDALRVERCVIMAWDRSSNSLNALAEVADAYWPFGTGPVGDLAKQPLRSAALASGLPALAHAASPESDPTERDMLRAVGQHAMMGVPLWLGGRVIGLILLFSAIADYAFSDADVHQIEQVARSWEAALGPNAHETWHSRDNLQKLCSQVQNVPGVMRVVIEAWDRQANQTRRLCENGFALWTEQDGIRHSLNDHATMRRVLTIAQPKVVSLDNLEADPYERVLLEQWGGRVCLMAPLIVRGEPEGLVKLIDVDPARTFDAEQISLCQGIANVVGNAMENAHLYRSLERRAEALEAAYAELKHADDLKDALLQNLSHEIQTPLLHILGYAELMRNTAFGPLTSEQQEKLEFMISRAQHLSDLVSNIVTMQSLSNEAVESQPTDLDSVMEQVLRAWRPRAAEHGLTILAKAFGDLPLVWAVPRRIVEVVEHLLDNAIKFSAENTVIEVFPRVLDSVVEVHVKDQGVGIPKEARQRIFQRFFQVDSSATRQYGGTGLGLAIVYEIITQHGGQVWVESVPGQGSEFIFTLRRTDIGTARGQAAEPDVLFLD